MRYSKYLKDLGITRRDFFRMNHFGLRNEFEKIKYGTNYHEMWNLDIVLACEIYPRLKHLYEKYHYICNFSDRSLEYNMEDYKAIADTRFNKVLYALETMLKIRYDIIEQEESKDMLTNPESQLNRVKEGLKILGEGFWGVGI